MSRAARVASPPRGPDGLCLPHPDGYPQLALNSAAVPGGLGADPLTEPVEVAGVTWVPGDADPWAAPIGYTLAVETAGGAR